MINIGETYNYLRATPDGEILEGVGIVKSIFLDPRKRLMVGLQDTTSGETYNVDHAGVDPAPDMREKYAHIIEQVTKISTEGNEKVKELVEAYNKDVEVLYSSVLGKPFDIPDANLPEKD